VIFTDWRVNMDQEFNLNCPLPIGDYPAIMLGHGGGGKLMHQLIDNIFLAAFDNELLRTQHDSAVINLGGLKLAFTTDSYVVSPLFFPGGDIGCLAVNGSVNDLAMSGARPLYLSAGFILEEGLSMEELNRVAQSMQRASEAAGVQLVTGDTKVVEKGKGDALFINTSGIGLVEHDLLISPASVRPGDAVLISGDIGRHGIAVMSSREGLAFESKIESDTAAVADLILLMLEEKIEIHCLRDLTRGGLASAVIEIAQAAGLEIMADETAIPVRRDVRAACELLGFDPIYVANEGCFVAFVPAADAERALSVMRSHPLGGQACRIGEATGARQHGRVVMRGIIGTTRLVDMLSGEQLPRIC
jgi:hydrogenase expression/formation protein HypE